MSLVAVEFTLDQAEEFYRRCVSRGVQTVEQKNEILMEMIKEGKVQAVTETNRTKEQYVQDTAQHRGTVLVISPEGEQK